MARGTSEFGRFGCFKKWPKKCSNSAKNQLICDFLTFLASSAHLWTFLKKRFFWSFFEKIPGPKYGFFAFLTNDVFKFEIGDFDPPKIDRKITLQWSKMIRVSFFLLVILAYYWSFLKRQVCLSFFDFFCPKQIA